VQSFIKQAAIDTTPALCSVVPTAWNGLDGHCQQYGKGKNSSWRMHGRPTVKEMAWVVDIYSNSMKMGLKLLSLLRVALSLGDIG
jgi:hypothetical protein